MDELFEIGRIIKPHGIKGELKLFPYTENYERYLKLKTILIDNNTDVMTYKVESVRINNNYILLKLEHVDDRDSADKLIGSNVMVDRENALKLPPGEYFTCDIIGCSVFEEDNLLGTITDVLHTGSNDVYVIKNQNENEDDILIPALKSVVKNIDIDERKIEVVIPEGLIDNEI